MTSKAKASKSRVRPRPTSGASRSGFISAPHAAASPIGDRCNLSKEGRRRIAVNLRLTEPEAVAQIPIDHFEGLESFKDLPRDGRCVAGYWF